MKKIIFALWVVSLGLSNVAWSAACGTSGATTVFPTSAGYANNCSLEPDYFGVTIYKMMLCTSAPVAPTTAAIAGTSTCQTVFANATGSAVSITSGASSELSGTATRPNNGTYTHAIVEMSNVLTIGDSREYSTSLDGYNITTNSSAGAGGVFCATTANGSTCGASAITAVNYPSELSDMDGPNGVFENQKTGIANAEGTSSVYLVDSAYLLEASATADVTYLVGVQAFTTPIVITDDTASMDVAFTSSTGMSVFDVGGGTVDDVYPTTGPFALKMTTK